MEFFIFNSVFLKSKHEIYINFSYLIYFVKKMEFFNFNRIFCNSYEKKYTFYVILRVGQNM